MEDDSESFELEFVYEQHNDGPARLVRSIESHPDGRRIVVEYEEVPSRNDPYVRSRQRTAGDEVTWRARHLGVWQELTSRITAFDRPQHFRDTMVRGAFARFDHDHYFESVNDGTLMRDVFDYRAPLGPLGWVAERLSLTAYMRRFLSARLRELKAIAESDEWSRLLPRSTL